MVDNEYGKQIHDFDNLDKEIKILLTTALEAREFSYSPYSKFRVGAALKTDSGKIYTGCNVECKSFSPTVCAERTAVCKAVSEGHKKFISVAVVAYQATCFTAPCGVCREVLSEFANKDFDVYLAKPDLKNVLHLKLSALLPLSFDPIDLLM